MVITEHFINFITPHVGKRKEVLKFRVNYLHARFSNVFLHAAFINNKILFLFFTRREKHDHFLLSFLLLINNCVITLARRILFFSSHNHLYFMIKWKRNVTFVKNSNRLLQQEDNRYKIEYDFKSIKNSRRKRTLHDKSQSRQHLSFVTRQGV